MTKIRKSACAGITSPCGVSPVMRLKAPADRSGREFKSLALSDAHFIDVNFPNNSTLNKTDDVGGDTT